MLESIGFIGLGQLGLPMATNLLNAGHFLRVYNRTASKAAPLVARGAQQVSTPAEVLTPGGTVVTVVWDDAALESVVGGAGFLERLGPGGLHVSMSTVSPAAARRIAALHAAHGSLYLEAPVFGRPEAATARKLWIPFAGSSAAKERGRPLLETLGAQGSFDFGEAAGSAVLVKLAGNFLLISAARSLVEAATLAEQGGVDRAALIGMLTSTLFDAPIYKSYGKLVAERAPLMVSEIPLKDLGLFNRTGAEVHAPTPISTHLEGLLKSLRGQ